VGRRCARGHGHHGVNAPRQAGVTVRTDDAPIPTGARAVTGHHPGGAAGTLPPQGTHDGGRRVLAPIAFLGGGYSRPGVEDQLRAALAELQPEKLVGFTDQLALAAFAADRSGFCATGP